MDRSIATSVSVIPENQKFFCRPSRLSVFNVRIVGIAKLRSATLKQLNSGESSSSPTQKFVPDKALANTTFHLKFDQSVHLDRVFHGQFFDQWFDKAGHDHC